MLQVVVFYPAMAVDPNVAYRGNEKRVGPGVGSVEYEPCARILLWVWVLSSVAIVSLGLRWKKRNAYNKVAKRAATTDTDPTTKPINPAPSTRDPSIFNHSDLPLLCIRLDMAFAHLLPVVFIK